MFRVYDSVAGKRGRVDWLVANKEFIHPHVPLLLREIGIDRCAQIVTKSTLVRILDRGKLE
jgi:hypothetical protein